MNPILKLTVAVISIATFGMFNLACQPDPPPAQLIPPAMARQACVEEAGDNSPTVFEFAWMYPSQPSFDNASCQPATNVRVDLWIALTAGQPVAQLLCTSKHGLARGPIGPSAVWLQCMDVRKSDIGLNN